MLTLPFGGAVLRKIGVSTPESSTIMEDFRRKYIEVDAVQDDSEGGDFFDLFRRRLPTDAVEEEQIEQKRQDEVDKNINNAISDMIVTDSIATIKELEDDNIAEENLNEPFYALRVSEEELEEGIKQKVHPMIDYQVEKLIEQREKRKNELVVGDKSMESKLDEALEHFESSDNVSFPVVAQAPELLDDKGST